MNISKSVLVAVVALSAIGVQAKTHSLGLLSDEAPTSFDYGVSKGFFTDFIKFKVDDDNTGFDFVVSDVKKDLSFQRLILWSFGTDGKFGTMDDQKIDSTDLFKKKNNQEELSLSWDEALNKGKYYLQVSGWGLGKKGGEYSGTITPFTAPVPEPESYAMFLAGLGLMGTIARRRKQSKAA